MLVVWAVSVAKIEDMKGPIVTLSLAMRVTYRFSHVRATAMALVVQVCRARVCLRVCKHIGELKGYEVHECVHGLVHLLSLRQDKTRCCTAHPSQDTDAGKDQWKKTLTEQLDFFASEYDALLLGGTPTSLVRKDELTHRIMLKRPSVCKAHAFSR